MFYGPPSGLPDGQLREWRLVAAGGSWACCTGDRTVQIGLACRRRSDHSVPLICGDKDCTGAVDDVAADGAARSSSSCPAAPACVSRRSSDAPARCRPLVADWSSFGDMDSGCRTGGADVSRACATRGAVRRLRRPIGRAMAGRAGLAYDSNPAPDAGVPAYFPRQSNGDWGGRGAQDQRDLRVRLAVSVPGKGDRRSSRRPTRSIPALRR